MEAVIRQGIDRLRLAALGAMALTLVVAVPLFASVRGVNPHAAASTCLLYFLEFDRVLLVIAVVLVAAFFRMRDELPGAAAGAMPVALLVVELTPIAVHRHHRRADIWTDVPPYVRFLQRATGACSASTRCRTWRCPPTPSRASG